MRRRRMATLLGTVGLALSLTAPTAAGAQSPGAPQGSRYDHVVQRDDPVGYWPQQADSGRMVRDLTRRSPDGIVHGSPRVETMPNGDKTLVFDGDEDYVEIADADTLSTATTGEITVEAWLRPDVLTFRKTRSSGYVHWMGTWSARQDRGPRPRRRRPRSPGPGPRRGTRTSQERSPR